MERGFQLDLGKKSGLHAGLLRMDAVFFNAHHLPVGISMERYCSVLMRSRREKADQLRSPSPRRDGPQHVYLNTKATRAILERLTTCISSWPGDSTDKKT